MNTAPNTLPFHHEPWVPNQSYRHSSRYQYLDNGPDVKAPREPVRSCEGGTLVKDLDTKPRYVKDTDGQMFVMKGFSYTRKDGTTWFRSFKKSNGEYVYKDRRVVWGGRVNPRAVRRKNSKSKRKANRK